MSAKVLDPCSSEKEYGVLVKSERGDAALKKREQSYCLYGHRITPARITRLRGEKGSTWLRVTLRERHKWQMHWVDLLCDHPVAHLNNERIHPLRWKHLQVGQRQRAALQRAARNRWQQRSTHSKEHTS